MFINIEPAENIETLIARRKYFKSVFPQFAAAIGAIPRLAHAAAEIAVLGGQTLHAGGVSGLRSRA